ncbi:chemotaxis protein CheW [Chitiniphilus eburneus]|uniref:Chemotaxis protein CheW n=1 Tax=Chitiniphilus eburneus TaxID=2571148 RepID=A0A4V5MQ06_9NEIS|nr:chemotaxis protein CheW [Chitiniphilus eburneus]TJZ70728.1 chemotaxis protein CheW [Chitiniphilus eburneus]
MAKRISLREYQEGVVARLKTAAATAQVDARLGVRIDQRNWLLDLGDVAEVMPVPAISGVPLARPWFRGTSNIRGNLVSVSDLAVFFGGAPLATHSANRLILLHPRHLPHAAVLVERMLGLKHLADLTHAGDGGDTPWSGAVYDDAAGTRWQVLDIPRLASEPGFLQAGLD